MHKHKGTAYLEADVARDLAALAAGGMDAGKKSLLPAPDPRGQPGQYFGFFSLSTRFASIAGPLIFALVRDMTGNGRVAILAVAVLFLAGGTLLAAVKDPEVA